ncbi:MAG: phosphoserine phosphatase SerB, partial [Candidatus Bathyarchaeia archaeon]
VAIFDIESVLIDSEFFPLIAKLVGKEDWVTEITMKGIRGEIRWEEGLKERISIVKDVTYKDVLRVINEMPYMPGAKEACRELKRRGYILIGVTGGFSPLAERVKRELDFDYVFSNELAFNEGKLSGLKKLNVTSRNVNGLESTLSQIGAKKQDILAVVDGANDMKLFKYAGLSIAFNAQPIVKEHADVVIDEKDLRGILEYINH